MEKLTKKQREVIYKDAAYCASEYNYEVHLCNQLKHELQEHLGLMYKSDYEYMLNMLPEFDLFTPEREIALLMNWGFDNNNERIICMLLCAEMCKD